MKKFAFGFIALIGLCGGQVGAAYVDTSPSFDGTSYVYSLGVTSFENGRATFGQTFTVDAGLGTQLDNFSFWLASYGNDGPTPFSAYVAAWDGTKITGPILFKSDSSNLPTAFSPFTKYTFETGGLQLTAGTQYVAFLSVSEYFTGGSLARMGVTSGDVYSGGGFVAADNGSNFSALSSTSWGQRVSADVAFQASFSTPSDNVSATPEPASMTLLGIGGAVSVLGYRLRRRKTEAPV